MLYHISIKELIHKKLNFKPRVPRKSNRLDNEDATIKRICVSDSIEGCLNAIKEVIGDKVIIKEYKTFKPVPIYVYGIDETKINKVLKPEEVFKYVDDALKNNEYWILEPITLEYIKTIYLDHEMQYHVKFDDNNDEPPYIDYEYDGDFEWYYHE